MLRAKKSPPEGTCDPAGCHLARYLFGMAVVTYGLREDDQQHARDQSQTGPGEKQEARYTAGTAECSEGNFRLSNAGYSEFAPHIPTQPDQEDEWPNAESSERYAHDLHCIHEALP